MVPPGSWCPTQTVYSAYREWRYGWMDRSVWECVNLAYIPRAFKTGMFVFEP